MWDPDRGHNKGQRIEGLDFYVDHLTWKKLPKKVFDIYGGYERAKELRKEMGYRQKNTLADPVTSSANVGGATTANPAKNNIQSETRAAVTVTTAVLNPLEIARRELLQEDIATSSTYMFDSALPTIAQIRSKIKETSAECIHNERDRTELAVFKKPRVESDYLKLPENYYLPTVTWQLLDK